MIFNEGNCITLFEVVSLRNSMSQPNADEVLSFVETRYGDSCKQNLLNITKGGSNNQKGRDYENQFLLYKVFEIAAKYSHDCENQIIETQAVSFVDDICHIDYEENKKYNYQAKNSSSSAADWTDETTKRFKIQREIDKELFGVSSTQNVLLVSDENKAKLNASKIPDDLNGRDLSQYFKYHENNYSLLAETDLRKYIDVLVQKQSPSTYDFAVTLVTGVLQSGNYKTIKEVFTKADFDGHPSPFVKFRQRRDAISDNTTEIPDWVKQILTKNSHYIIYKVDYNILTVTVNEMFTVTCNINSLYSVSDEVAQRVLTPQDLVNVFLKLTGSDIEKSLNPYSKGEEK